MSGNSYGGNCPNCGSSTNVYSDHKPFEFTTIECIHCGFNTNVEIDYYSLEDLNSIREEIDLELLKELPNQNKNIW